MRRAVNAGVTVFVSIKTDQHSLAWLENFHAAVVDFPEVVEFYRMSGEVDYLLRVVVPDIAAYDAFYKKLISRIEISKVSSAFAMEQIKYTTALPLDFALRRAERSQSRASAGPSGSCERSDRSEEHERADCQHRHAASLDEIKGNSGLEFLRRIADGQRAAAADHRDAGVRAGRGGAGLRALHDDAGVPALQSDRHRARRRGRDAARLAA